MEEGETETGLEMIMVTNTKSSQRVKDGELPSCGGEEERPSGTLAGTGGGVVSSSFPCGLRGVRVGTFDNINDRNLS